MQMLAPELLVHVLSFLDTPSLVRGMRVSKAWHEVIVTHDETLWQPRANAEFRVQAPCNKPGGDHATWKLCCKCQQVTDARRNHGLYSYRTFPKLAKLPQVWRVQPDQAEQVLYCTSRADILGSDGKPIKAGNGGLHSVDMATGEILFSVPDVKQYAHIEYSNGYIIVTGEDQDLLVYATRTATPASLSPTELVLRNANVTREEYRAQYLAQENREEADRRRRVEVDGEDKPPVLDRGEIRFVGTLRSPKPYRALRMVGRTLVVAGLESIAAWDIPTMTLMRAVAPRIGQSTPMAIRYVEHDERYVFVIYSSRTISMCFAFDLHVDGDCLKSRVPLRALDDAHWAKVTSYDADVFGSLPPSPNAFNENRLRAGYLKYRPIDEAYLERVLAVGFIACHIAGPHLIIATSGGLVIVPDYAASLNGLDDMASIDGFGEDPLLIGLPGVLDVNLATYEDRIVIFVSTATMDLKMPGWLLEIDSQDLVRRRKTAPKIRWTEATSSHMGLGRGAIQLSSDGVYFSGTVKKTGIEPHFNDDEYDTDVWDYPIHCLTARHAAGAVTDGSS